MKWLQDNPLGTALLAAIGVFLLISLSLVIVGALPVSTEIEAVIAEETSETEAVNVVSEAGPLRDYQVINEKPVFNISRLPATEVLDVDGSADDESIAIKDAPEVKLTGVIITPGVRIASLKPVQGKQESVMAREGEALTGEYVGWQVSSVQPRNVVLESRDGQKLELELQVHDIKIEEPPKPKPAAKTAQAENEQRGEEVSEDGEPLSRAEQIRLRIAERREELRREQEEQQAQQELDEDSDAQSSKPQDYQSAIRAMINRKPKDNSNDDDNDS